MSRSWTRPKLSDAEGEDLAGSLGGDGGATPDGGHPDGGQPDGGQPDGGQPDGGPPLSFAPSIFDTSFQHTAYNDGDTVTLSLES